MGMMYNHQTWYAYEDQLNFKGHQFVLFVCVRILSFPSLHPPVEMSSFSFLLAD